MRPTPDRIRETLFNWLQPWIEHAVCLDLFAGSGVLGLEALSRGADEVVAVDSDAASVLAIRTANQELAAGLEVVQQDVLRFLDRKGRRFDIVFVDPPYASGLQAPVCRLLHERGWLGPQALVYVESPRGRHELSVPPGWVLHRSAAAGNVMSQLYRLEGSAAVPD